MSSFLKKGKRIKVREEKKDVKKRTKDFYAILHELDRVAEILKKDETVDVDNFVEKAQLLTDRTIEERSMESFILRGKLGFYGTMEKDLPNGENNT